MSNFSILIIYCIINCAVVTTAYRFFGKKGIIAFIILSVLAANIQVNKIVEYNIFGFHFSATMGNVMFAGILYANDLINEKYGNTQAKQAVYISLFSSLSFIFMMFFSTLMHPSHDNIEASNSLNLFFSINGSTLKAVIIGVFVYFISQFLDVIIYSRIRSKLNGLKWLWLRNSGSTAISQVVDCTLITVGFTLAGIIPKEIALEVGIATLAIKYILVFIQAPLFYLSVFVMYNKPTQ